MRIGVVYQALGVVYRLNVGDPMADRGFKC
jgi:hypothetical protein